MQRGALNPGLQAVVGRAPVELVQLLIGQAAQPRHEAEAQETIQAEEVFSVAVRVGRMLLLIGCPQGALNNNLPNSQLCGSG